MRPPTQALVHAQGPSTHLMFRQRPKSRSLEDTERHSTTLYIADNPGRVTVDLGRRRCHKFQGLEYAPGAGQVEVGDLTR